MEPISVREILILKRVMFAAWELLSPPHRMIVLNRFAHDRPAGGWVMAAEALNKLMEEGGRAQAEQSGRVVAGTEAAGPVRVLLVDECPGFRLALYAALATTDTDFEVAEAGTAAQALELVLAIGPEVAVIDVDLPDMSGFELCRRFAKEFPGTRTLLMSVHDWDIHLVQAVLVGAAGFVWKNAEPEHLVQAVRRAAGEAAFTEQQIRRMRAWADGDGRELSEVTARELEVFRLVVAGKTNAEIAEELMVTEDTIETHLNHLFQRLHVRSKLKLSARWAGGHLGDWVLPTFAAAELEEKIADFRDYNQAHPC